MIVELTNILSGSYFDCDRHGNQLRVKIDENNIDLGLYDFGEMASTEPNQAELIQLAAVYRIHAWENI